MTSEKQRNEIVREMESRFGTRFQVHAERDEVYVSFPIEDPRSGYRYASAITRRNLDGRKAIKEEDFDAIEEGIRDGFREKVNDVRLTEQAKNDYRLANEALSMKDGYSYCECSNRLETPAEYEDGVCEWCYEIEMNRQEEESDDSLIVMSNYLVKSFSEGGYIRLDFGAPNPMGTWVSSILIDKDGYMVGDGRTKEVCYNGYTNRELIELELERHQK